MSSCEVTYVDHMGHEKRIVEAARVSFYKASTTSDTELDNSDRRLIRFLAREKHTSPFEHCTISLNIKCPLIVRSQIMRHRTFSFNEVSRRYTSRNIEFYKTDTLRTQSKENLQCSSGSVVSESSDLLLKMEKHFADSEALYNELLENGVAREQARLVLPQSLMTSFIMTGNLLNWMKFLKLRLDEHAQPECQDVAKQCKDIISQHFPYVTELFLDS